MPTLFAGVLYFLLGAAIVVFVEFFVLFAFNRRNVQRTLLTVILMNGASFLLNIVLVFVLDALFYRDVGETSPIPDIVTPSIFALLAICLSIAAEAGIITKMDHTPIERSLVISSVANTLSGITTIIVLVLLLR